MKKISKFSIVLLLILCSACAGCVIGTDEKQLDENVIIENAIIGNGFGFYHNNTTNSYYEHQGIDFLADVGTEVFAYDDGTVIDVNTSNVLDGPFIVISHANGVQTTYRFVNSTVVVGDDVKKGKVVATVAEGSGNEYKTGPHLHFEISVNGTNIDPNRLLKKSSDVLVQNGIRSTGFEFYYNSTVNSYYNHQGIDFLAEAGAFVYAYNNGIVEEVGNDAINGGYIILSHADGLKSVYKFVVPGEINVGDVVVEGEIIAVVSEPVGNEYKIGAHMHFEILLNSEYVDPAPYLEKKTS